jgi:hypothetical protein
MNTMPMKLNVGVSRKVGLPDYCSAGATCNIEIELDSALLERDLDEFHARVRDAYVAANQAVHDELTRLGVGPVEPAPTRSGGRNGASRRNASNGSHPPERTRGSWGASAQNGGRPNRTRKPATAAQVKAIIAIARRSDTDLQGLLRADYGVDHAEELSIAEASQLIDQLKAPTES